MVFSVHAQPILEIPISKRSKEEYPSLSIPMERTRKILRRSIYTFLQNYHYLTTIGMLLAFPFSAAVLLSQALLPSSPLLPLIHNRLRSLFNAAGFPSSSQLIFSILNLKLSQTITCSILVLPFALSFYTMAKASVVQALTDDKSRQKKHSFSSFLSIYSRILLTQFWASFVILSANASCFFLLFFAFNCLEILGYSSPNSTLLLSVFGAILYSIVLANALIICNLALASSGMEKINGGYVSILRACVLIRGRTTTGLTIALPLNMAMAAIEALFQYRVVRAYHHTLIPNFSLALEGVLIAYLYSIVLVLDFVVSCVFFNSCRASCLMDQGNKFSSYQIQTEEERGCNLARVNTLEELL